MGGFPLSNLPVLDEGLLPNDVTMCPPPIFLIGSFREKSPDIVVIILSWLNHLTKFSNESYRHFVAKAILSSVLKHGVLYGPVTRYGAILFLTDLVITIINSPG